MPPRKTAAQAPATPAPRRAPAKKAAPAKRAPAKKTAAAKRAPSKRAAAKKTAAAPAPEVPALKDDLVWMRTTLRQSIEDSPPEKRAPLVKQLREVVAQLEALAPQGKVDDPVDEVAARRAARRAAG